MKLITLKHITRVLAHNEITPDAMAIRLNKVGIKPTHRVGNGQNSLKLYDPSVLTNEALLAYCTTLDSKPAAPPAAKPEPSLRRLEARIDALTTTVERLVAVLSPLTTEPAAPVVLDASKTNGTGGEAH